MNTETIQKNSKLRELCVELGWELAASCLIAVGVNNFALAAALPMTGVSGIAMILFRFFGIPVGVATILINIPLALGSYRILGRRFFVRSLRCMALSSIMIDYFAPLFPNYQGDRMLASLCTGVLAGLGYALVYMRESSNGGIDFIIMDIKAKWPYVSLGKIVFAVDLVIVVAAGMIFGDVDGILYGLIVNFIFAYVTDKVMYGANAGKMAFIVTDHGPMICAVIQRCCGRGSTILNGQGGYRKDQKAVVMCACNDKQMYHVHKEVHKADPDSFMIVLESREVHGRGFKMLQVGEKEED